MFGTDSDPCADSAISRQHIQIESLVEALHGRFEARREVSRNLVSLLNSLAAHLEAHFELEEEGGFFTDIVQRAPHLSAQAETLLKQHGMMLDKSRELVTLARDAFSKGLEISSLAEKFAKLRSELLTHEQAENDLLQEACTAKN